MADDPESTHNWDYPYSQSRRCLRCGKTDAEMPNKFQGAPCQGRDHPQPIEVRDYDMARSLLRGMTPMVSRHYTDPGYPQEVLDVLHQRAQAIAMIIGAVRREGRESTRA